MGMNSGYSVAASCALRSSISFCCRCWFGDDDNLPMIAIKCICEHGREEYHENPRRTYLQYWDIGCERGHRLEGRIKKRLPNGIIFEWSGHHRSFKLTELTMEEIERRVRPSLDEYESNCIHDFDDAYVFYRRMVGLT